MHTTNVNNHEEVFGVREGLYARNYILECQRGLSEYHKYEKCHHRLHVCCRAWFLQQQKNSGGKKMAPASLLIRWAVIIPQANSTLVKTFLSSIIAHLYRKRLSNEKFI